MLRPILIISILLCLVPKQSNSQPCSQYTFSTNQAFAFSSCNDLPNLNSHLHWTFDRPSNTLQIAYRHTGIASSRWAAWALNPSGRGMVGAQALVAFQKSDGSMTAYTSPVSSYQTSLQQGDLSFPVSNLSATYTNNEIIIFATLRLDNNISYDNANQVWQEGPVSGDSPGMHPTTGANIQSAGTLNFLSGSTAGGGAVDSRFKKKNIHGVLNTVSWGILLPIGAVFARYLKVFPSADPAWFYLHAACQGSAYVVGVAGWATGLRLGAQSPGVEYTAHRVIGIVLFCLATLQVSAMLLRPKKEHKHRVYWNVYHHLTGYSVIVLSIVNIFKGFAILNPDEKWKTAYVGILIGLAFVAAVLEVYTWCVVLKRKKSSQTQKMSNGGNGGNGYNGFRV